MREGLGRREDRKTGRGWRRSAILCKPAFQSLPLSQKPSLHSPAEMQLHSFSSALCQRRRRGTGASCAREGFPTLLSPAFSAGVSSKSQQAQESQQAAPGELVITAQKVKWSISEAMSHPMGQYSWPSSLAEPKGANPELQQSAAALALTEHQNELRRLKLGIS